MEITMDNIVIQALIVIVSIAYPLLVCWMYKMEYDSRVLPETHKRNLKVHGMGNRGVIRRGWEWDTIDEIRMKSKRKRL